MALWCSALRWCQLVGVGRCVSVFGGIVRCRLARSVSVGVIGMWFACRCGNLLVLICVGVFVC